MTALTHGAEVVALARGWIGTPYCHQASLRGVGSDCLGLIRGIWRDLYGPEPEILPGYTPDWSEPSRDEVLWRGALRHLVPLPAGARPEGAVLLFRMRRGSVAKHLGIAAQGAAGPAFIHAYSGHGVVESALTAPWARCIVAAFAFPERQV